MANQYINIYKESTSGLFNSIVSSDGSGSNPITIGPLNIAANETGQKRLLLKTEVGYKTVDGTNTTITPVGTSAAKWQLAPDVSGSPGSYQLAGAALVLTSAITTTGTYFWAKASTSSTEIVQNDTSVDLQVSYSVQAI